MQEEQKAPEEKQAPQTIRTGGYTAGAASPPDHSDCDSGSASPEPLLGTRGEALFRQLISEIDLVDKFARRGGKPLSSTLQKEIAELLANTPSPTTKD